MSLPKNLSKPFFVLAPMDDVTDTVFRQVVADCGRPDLFFTEFVNVDGLQSPGRSKLIKKLQFTDKETPIIAQIWGKNPENYYKTTLELKKMGFAGVDINMGCPDKAVMKNGCCAALIDNRELAGEIIEAVQRAAGDDFPVSVKTRVGITTIDLSWIEFLLKYKLNMLTIHARTAKEMSKVPAHWDLQKQIVELRNSLSPSTLLIGNGDVASKQQGKELAKQYGLDGIMIGRGVFDDPYVFAAQSDWKDMGEKQRKELYAKHVKLFQKTWEPKSTLILSEDSHVDGVQGDNEKRTSGIGNTVSESRKQSTPQSPTRSNRVSSSAAQQVRPLRNIRTLNKFCKMYIQGFDGAKELREKLMEAKSTDELLALLQE